MLHGINNGERGLSRKSLLTHNGITLIQNSMKKSTFFYLIGLLTCLPIVVMSQNNFVGHVFYHNNPEYPLPEVNVGLYDLDSNLIATYFTDEDGLFQFEDVPEGEYIIKSTTELPVGQITIQHALNIIFYLNGLMEFTPYQLMAADVTGNGVVNMYDFTYIVVQYLVYGNPFPAGEWQFEDLMVTTLGRDGEDTTSVGGTRTAETGGVWLPTGRNLVDELSLTLDDKITIAGDEQVKVPLRLNNSFDINGFLMVLDYDQSLFEFIEMDTEFEDVAVSVHDGQIRFSWVNVLPDMNSYIPHELAELTFGVVQQGGYEHQDAVFKINPESHFIDRFGEIANYVELFTPAIEFAPMVLEEHFVISPNPATSVIHISFEDGFNNKEVSIFNMAGQMVKAWQKQSSPQTGSIYVGDLIPGIYQVVVFDHETRKTFQKRLLIK